MSWGALFSKEPIAWFPRSQTKAQTTDDWRKWISGNFPHVATKPFGERHVRLWEWFASIERGRPVPPRVEVWPRGGAKSSTGELGCAYVGDRLTRRFCLYVSETQEQADRHVQAVASLLEKLGHAAAVNKTGHSKGWRRNQLRSSNGFNVAAFGLDTGARGVKLDEFRPDLIILDDIDGRHDTPRSTAKKESIITQTLLPAGSADAVILFLQNLIIEDGIVARMVDRRAEYLLSAEIVGPEPAIKGLVVEDRELPNGRRYKAIVSGEPTWEGQDLETCQRQIIEWGWPSFKRESQHEVKGADGLYFDIDAIRYCDPTEIPPTLRLARGWDLAATQGGGDYTAGVLVGRDPDSGVAYVIDVKRHQYASNDVRSLIDRTATHDAKGEVHEADHVTESGAFAREGRTAFTFHPGRTPKLILPHDPGQAGKAQAEQFREAFAHHLTATVLPTGRKSVRARNVQEAVNEGNVIVVRGEWNHWFLEELRRFREDETHDHDDQVDALADAFNELAQVRTGWGDLLKINA